jgi:hypothetical protein
LEKKENKVGKVLSKRWLMVVIGFLSQVSFSFKRGIQSPGHRQFVSSFPFKKRETKVCL